MPPVNPQNLVQSAAPGAQPHALMGDTMADMETVMETMASLVAIERLLDQGSAAVPALIEYVAGSEPVLAHAAMRSLYALLPTAALPKRWQEGACTPQALDPDTALFNAAIPAWITANPYSGDGHAALGRLCVDQIQRLPDAASRNLFIERLALLSGARQELIASFQSKGLHKEAKALEQAVAQLARQQYPQQVSFSPTMRCQLHCPYCIAGANSPVAAEPEAEPAQLEALLAWMQQHELTRLGLTGGEPSRYSRFPALLARLRSAGLEYYMASNGLMDEAAQAAILANPPLCLTLHLTPEVLHSSQLEQFIETARRLRQAGIYAILRCNFASPAVDTLAYLQVAQSCAIQELRIAIPMPNSQRGNSYVDLAGLAAFAPLLHTLVQKAEQQAMQIQLSKPYPICFMPQEVARHFLKNGSIACLCPSYLLGFSNNIVVYPDLRFSACLGLNERSSMPITACAGPEQAALVFAGTIEKRMHSPIMAECCSCPLGRYGQCIGACLSYRPEMDPVPFPAFSGADPHDQA